MELVYADPPYPGCAHLYKDQPDYAGEVDHVRLTERLREYDGWALSTSAPALHNILPLCPEARIASWVKPFAVFKPNVNPAYTWEPVLFVPARRRERKEPTVKDHLVESVTLRKGLTGAKPRGFGFWIFDLLQATPQDEFTDMFPGTGAVSRAWAEFSRSEPLELFGEVL